MSPPPDRRPIVSVFGSYRPRPGEPLYEQAYAIGRALGAAGYVVCNGGYDGTMAASARGAREAGGATIGVTCGIFSDERGRPLSANTWIDREIRTDDLLTRIDTMMRLSAAFVVLEGGTGTLAEFSLVWEFVGKKLIAPRPIFVVGEFWRPVVERVRAVRPHSCSHVHGVTTAEEILERLRAAAVE